MSSEAKIDPSQPHFQVLGLDENATIVRRQIEEAYEKRARQALGRLRKIDAESEEAQGLHGRLAQLNAARAVLVARKSRQAYAQQLRKLRDAQREFDAAQGKSGGKKDDSSAVLILHLRQQVERAREELLELHQEHYRRHAYDHDESQRPAADQVTVQEQEEGMRRRTARAGEVAAALAALAEHPPTKRRSA